MSHNTHAKAYDTKLGRSSFPGGLESLEARQLLSSVCFERGILTLRADDGRGQELRVTLNRAGNKVTATVGNAVRHVLLEKVRRIRMFGASGNDLLVVDENINAPVSAEGRDGNDTIITGGGNDTIKAGSGSDQVLANRGDDSMSGGTGNDFLDGGPGNDRVHAGPGQNRVRNATHDAGLDDTLTVNPPVQPPSNPVTRPSIARLTLVNADRDQTLAGFETLLEGAVLDVTKLGTRNLNVVAVGGSSTPGSVRFALNDSTNFRTENAAPFALGGDSGAGDFYAWTPAVGTYTLTATPYSGPNATGIAGAPLTVRFTVTRSQEPTPPGNIGSGNHGSSGNSNTDPGNNSGNNQGNNPGNNSGNNPGSGSGNSSGNNAAGPRPSARIEFISTTVMAGQAIHASAVKSSLGSGTPSSARYDWDFGDSAGAYNSLRGFNAAHVYDRPGVYNVTLTVTNELGVTDIASAQVQVLADTRRAIFVSASGNDSNSGASPETAVRSIGRVRQLLSDNCTVLFRRGETFDIASTLEIYADNVAIETYGSGAAPTIRWTGTTATDVVMEPMRSSENVSIRGLRFVNSGQQHIFHPQGVNFTVRDCEFVDANYVLNTNAVPRGVLAQNNVVTHVRSMKGYFAWVEGTDHVYLGNRVPNSYAEHIVRVGNGSRVLVAFNDFKNVGSQVSGMTGDIEKQTVTIQLGSYAYVWRNNLAFGRLEIGPLGGVDGAKRPNRFSERFTHAVAEENRIDTWTRVEHGSTDVALRDNLITASNMSAIIVRGYSDEFRRGVEGLVIDHNTVRNSAGGGQFLRLEGPASNIRLTDNLYIAPNINLGWGNAPVYVTDTSLRSFTRISGNVWPAERTNWYVSGGIHHVGIHVSPSSYQSKARWEANWQVSNESYRNILLDGTVRVQVDGRTVGARYVA
jgi:PKD repeat protein